MADLPAPIREFIDGLTDDLLAPAYLLVTDAGRLSDWGGALESYGISGLEKNIQVDEHLLFLAGLLPLGAAGVFLPNVQTNTGVFADVYLFRRVQGSWVLLLDATESVKKRQVLQQRTYDISLKATELEREGKSLYDANSGLQQRVREQTRELSETVRRLQQELADSRRTEEALSESESRFRSLFNCNVIGIVFWDGSGIITEANDAFLALLGYSKDDLKQGLVTWDRITATDRVENSEAALSDTQDPAFLRQREFLRKDGSRTPLLFGAASQAESFEKRLGFVVSVSQHKTTAGS